MTEKPKRSFRPRIKYSHVLHELSVNSKNPCEVLRELVSNSYDAQATEIRYYPLLQKNPRLEGFIFFDNGIGMSVESPDNYTVPAYEAFFSIGHSTKIEGDCIGYKCQGAKLAFACRTLTVITRSKGEAQWRHKTVHNPRQELDQDTDLTPEYTERPWDVLNRQVGKNATIKTKRILHSLSEDFFRQNFYHGTMLIILGFETKPFDRYFGAKAESDPKYIKEKDRKQEGSYLWNYIRFFTRHGDVRVLNSADTGFSDFHTSVIEYPVTKKQSAPEVLVWIDKDIDESDERFSSQLVRIPPGYPYLRKPVKTPAGPKQITSLRNGRFYARHAGTFEYNDEYYTWILAIDGHQRALDEYESLNRHGAPRSGLKLSDQRGVHLCAQGIKICNYNELFEGLSDYEILSNPKAVPHYIFLLDGPFHLVTDRNAVTNSDLKTLSDGSFRKEIGKALDSIAQGGEDLRDGIDHNAVFVALVDRLKNDIPDHNLKTRLHKQEQLKKDLPERGYFTILSGALEGKSFVYPANNEENWVGALYTLFSHFAPSEPKFESSNLQDLWVRPINMANKGLDAHALPIDVDGLPKDKMKGLEYKLKFDPSVRFNHPLISVDYIVCWDFALEADKDTKVRDDFDYIGTVKLPEESNGSVFYTLTNIMQYDRSNPKKGHEIKVISLKRLIEATFDCEMVGP